MGNDSGDFSHGGGSRHPRPGYLYGDGSLNMALGGDMSVCFRTGREI